MQRDSSPASARARASLRPDAASVAGARAMYRWQAPVYDLTRWAVLRGRGTAVQRLDLATGQRALEVGCGTGTNLLHLRARVGSTGEVHGIDVSPHMLGRARHKVAQRGWRNVHLREHDAGDFDLGSAFDAILYSYSLSMIPQWRASLESAARHLAPGGRLVIVDFSPLERWGVLRRPVHTWLRAHHVEPERRYHEALAEIFGPAAVEWECSSRQWHFVARCRKRSD